jgi:hypothetical protein
MTISQIILLAAILGFAAGLCLASLLHHGRTAGFKRVINEQAATILALHRQRNEHRAMHAQFEQHAASDRAMDRHLAVYGWGETDWPKTDWDSTRAEVARRQAVRDAETAEWNQ